MCKLSLEKFQMEGKIMEMIKRLSLITMLFILFCNLNASEPKSARLFIELPTAYNTPDGAALDNILSIPNFNNDALLKAGKIDEPSPAVMAKIDKNNIISTWYTFKKEDTHPFTGRIGPMDAAFGPDGN